jgi:hypothetical protein
MAKLNPENVEKVEHLGEVRVDCYRVKRVGEPRELMNHILPEQIGTNNIQAKALKGQSVSARTGYLLRVVLDSSFTDTA